MTAIAHRYDFVLLFDVTRGNPNGDPDAGNLPRLDPETNHGLVSDVSLKRKIRNYVDLAHAGEDGLHIYVEDGSILNDKHRQAYRALRPDDSKVDKDAKLNPKDDAEARKLTDFMCRNFFDVRTFGAVMSTGVNCGQVRGPVQLTFAQSVEPIVPQEISITRMAATTPAEKKQKEEGDDSSDRTDNRTMGRKYIVPYGLYREMHHPFRPEAVIGFGNRLPVADVGLEEAVVRVVVDGAQRSERAGIGELVDGEHLVASDEHEMTNNRRSDEAGAAGDENAHETTLRRRMTKKNWPAGRSAGVDEIGVEF